MSCRLGPAVYASDVCSLFEATFSRSWRIPRRMHVLYKHFMIPCLLPGERKEQHAGEPVQHEPGQHEPGSVCSPIEMACLHSDPPFSRGLGVAKMTPFRPNLQPRWKARSQWLNESGTDFGPNRFCPAVAKVLFIFSGAFTGMNDIIKNRVGAYHVLTRAGF